MTRSMTTKSLSQQFYSGVVTCCLVGPVNIDPGYRSMIAMIKITEAITIVINIRSNPKAVLNSDMVE